MMRTKATWVRRNHLLLLTAALLAAALQLALPSLRVELPEAESESLQSETIGAARPTQYQTAGHSIS
jgi:hypothetical protein